MEDHEKWFDELRQRLDRMRRTLERAGGNRRRRRWGRDHLEWAGGEYDGVATGPFGPPRHDL